MGESPVFAEPLRVDDLAQCSFYHRMSLPGVGEVGEQWDLREVIDDYLGRFDFNGKRALDVGTASGFLSFEMEKRGADVVSFDMDDGNQWDVVPQRTVRQDPETYFHNLRVAHQKLKNAYWFAHARTGSRARVCYDNIYDLPAGLGRFDVAIMGMIVGHLRDPLHAIANVARLCSSHLIITNQAVRAKGPMASLMPSHENQQTRIWWSLSAECLQQMLRILGFDVERMVVSRPRCLVKGREGHEECLSLVARRVED